MYCADLDKVSRGTSCPPFIDFNIDGKQDSYHLDKFHVFKT